MKKVLIILGVIFVVGTGILYGAVLKKGNSYIKTANEYMSYINNGNANASYSLFSAKEKKAYKSDDWKKYVKDVANKFPSSCNKTTRLNINSAAKTTTSYACDFKLNNSNYRIIFVFITENSKIVIDELQGYAMP